MTMNQVGALPRRRVGFPSQIKYIVGNEACERFSFYGMRSILTVFMTQYLLMGESQAEGTYHLFVSANYFTPLIGGYLADRFLGKYRVIIYLSLFYCLGHGVLSVWDNKYGMYAGLALIALGAGGIKPCVSAHVGDQFDRTNSFLLDKIYMVFYWSVNFGSFFASLAIPWVLPHYGPSVAFGIPGVLMAIASVVFWMGRNKYVIVPPTGKEHGPKFLAILWYGLTHLGDRKKGQHFLDTARAKFDGERVDAAKAAVDVFKVLISVSAFWSLYDQTGGSWVLQAKQMDLNLFGIPLQAAQIQALNPILVLTLIPFFNFVIYPAVEKLGFKLTPLRKMGAGMVFTGLSFVFAATIQYLIEHGATLNIGWQLPQYVVLTMSEVMVSITGLEFAYTQAPRSMKSIIMSLWLLTITAGNLFTALFYFLNRFQGWGKFVFFAVSMFLVSGIFLWMANRYQYRDYVEDAKPA